MMLEGQIGKLVIRKSGKMQVQIGNVMYDLESADSNPTKEVCLLNWILIIFIF